MMVAPKEAEEPAEAPNLTESKLVNHVRNQCTA